MALTWPADLQITGIRVHSPQHNERSGGVSLGGRDQRVSSGYGWFKFGVTVQVRTELHWDALNAFLWEMGGNTVNVPLTYLQRRAGTAVVANGPVAVGSTQMDITVTGDPLTKGKYLSRDGKLYVIITIDAAGPPQTVTIRPPIRTALTNGWALLIADPVCEMRFAGPDTGTIELDVMQMGDTTLEFVQV